MNSSTFEEKHLVCTMSVSVLSHRGLRVTEKEARLPVNSALQGAQSSSSIHPCTGIQYLAKDEVSSSQTNLANYRERKGSQEVNLSNYADHIQLREIWR